MKDEREILTHSESYVKKTNRVILMVGVFIYPLVVFSGWWKFLFLISLVVIFASMLIEGNKKSEIVNKEFII